MTYSHDLSKMTIMDYQGLLRTIKDCHGLSWTVKNCQGLTWTVRNCHGLICQKPDLRNIKKKENWDWKQKFYHLLTQNLQNSWRCHVQIYRICLLYY